MTGDEPRETDAEKRTESLRWSVRLNSNRPVVRPVIFGVSAVAGLAGILIFHSPLMGILGAMMVLGVTADYWLGVNCSLSETEASARVGLSPTVMRWSDVKRVVISKASIKLSPLAEPTAADAFRGVTLPTTPETHPLALAWVKKYCGENVRFLGE